MKFSSGLKAQLVWQIWSWEANTFIPNLTDGWMRAEDLPRSFSSGGHSEELSRQNGPCPACSNELRTDYFLLSLLLLHSSALVCICFLRANRLMGQDSLHDPTQPRVTMCMEYAGPSFIPNIIFSPLSFCTVGLGQWPLSTGWRKGVS